METRWGTAPYRPRPGADLHGSAPLVPFASTLPATLAHPSFQLPPVPPAPSGRCRPDAASVAAWLRQRVDEPACIALRLQRVKLRGVSITSQTARFLRLSGARVLPINSISPDGVTFPREPAVFRGEVARQARDLYGGRAGLEMDADRLLRGAALCPASRPDTPEFRSQMGALLGCGPR